jgi:hypothetical protein
LLSAVDVPGVSLTEDIATRTGFTKPGVDKAGLLMTRGLPIDVAGFGERAGGAQL